MTYEVLGWRETTVIQKDKATGCVPAGFEWLARYHKVKEVNLDTFQDDFNLKKRGGENNFETVSKAIMHSYPHLELRTMEFKNGEDKLRFVEDSIKKNVPCLSPVFIPKLNKWHIVVIVGFDDHNVLIKNGKEELPISRKHVMDYSNDDSEGKDVAWLEVERNDEKRD